ncbi:phytoene/squalene synthase family protein [Myxococcota bacterium]|nr:phytoene/squalene synthase family protein [Myxococcota bacterium]
MSASCDMAPAADAPLIADSVGVLHKHARSFTWASWFLPAARRDDAAVLYHLCRLIDDLADEAEDAVAARKELDLLRDELHGRRPARPLVVASLRLLDERGRQAVDELIEGVLGDLGEVIVPDDAALLRYCYRVAGTVGLMMCPMLGVTDPRAAAYAIDLGIGMQLTNICRDVLEDAERGRVYLPATRLAAVGVHPADLLAGRASARGVAEVVRSLLELSRRYYSSGDAGMRFIPWRTRVAILVASRVYGAIGHRLARRGGDALAGRVIVPPAQKAVAVISGLWSSLRLALAAPRPHDEGLHASLAGLPGVTRSA